MSAARRWLWGFLGALSTLTLAVAVLVGSLFYPPMRDARRMQVIVHTVALDWRDFGQERAFERLQYELDHQGIGLEVGDGDCALDEEHGERSVRCAWDVQVEVPLVDWRVPLSFDAAAQVDEHGEVW